MNRLTNQNSPYLRQHANNPVAWYPWSEEALQLSLDQNKPILLSIGYAACHWCHVMAHESFEDPDTAAIMNTNFVNIKVDREERPDLDSIYMQAVVSITGQGGWPLTVFLTPDCEPFYGGTYFPPAPRYGMPSFKQVLAAVNDAWFNRRDEIIRTASELTNRISQSYIFQGQEIDIKPELLITATSSLAGVFDPHEGGFGGAPKFPPSMTIEFLLREHLRTGNQHALIMAELTLTKMAYGGIYDQIGGGFARYSTDNQWLVPHFEKMLYDNAQLGRVYLHAWQVTRNPLYKRISEETLDFVMCEMTDEEGGFYSSQDADSQGIEGKFYVWKPEEVKAVLDNSAQLVMEYYNIIEQGNWEGVNILHVIQDPESFALSKNITLNELNDLISQAKKRLYIARGERIRPGLDDKVLTAWNGLMLATFAEAGRVLQRKDYVNVAIRNAQFLYQNLRSDNGRLYRTWITGSQAKYNAYLEDYVYLSEGLLTLYQTTFDPLWFSWAEELVEHILEHFSDDIGGGFFDTSDDHEKLIHRPKDLQDNVTPSGNALGAHILLKLALFTGKSKYWELATSSISSMVDAMRKHPNAFAQWLSSASFMLSDPREVAIIGNVEDTHTQALLSVLDTTYRPNLVVAAGDEDNGEIVPLLADRPRIGAKSTTYVCKQFVCQQPVNEPHELLKLLS